MIIVFSSACDMSCKSCDGPGSGDCEACAAGYKESDDGVCEGTHEHWEELDIISLWGPRGGGRRYSMFKEMWH